MLILRKEETFVTMNIKGKPKESQKTTQVCPIKKKKEEEEEDFN